MLERPVQDYYPNEVANCYGCGRNNPNGLHIKTHWDGETGLCHFNPQPYHTAFPGVVYGGLLASIIDCHSIGTAIAALYQAEGRTIADDPAAFSCVTGNLNVRYHKPTPIDAELTLRATIKDLGERKALVVCSVTAGDVETVTGELVAVKVTARAHGA